MKRALSWQSSISLLALAAVIALSPSSSGCRFEVDPDTGRFSCQSVEDCGEGFECIPQEGRDDGLCYRAGECAAREEACDGRDDDCNGLLDDVIWAGAACDTNLPGECRAGARACVDGEDACLAYRAATAETCDGRDNDCDGQVDEDFDLDADPLHCGACNAACPAGTGCEAGLCFEVDCADGADNDLDGFVDCLDAQCLGRACGMPGDGQICRLVPVLVPEPDGGMVDPDGGFMDQDAGMLDPDGGVIDPDAGTAGPDGGVVDPDAGTTDPDGGVMNPDAGMVDPDGGSVMDPDAGMADPDGGVADPDGGMVIFVPACAAP